MESRTDIGQDGVAVAVAQGQSSPLHTRHAEPILTVVDLSKHFRRLNGSTVPAIDSVSLEVFPGEFVVLLGPSGCGKTTLLRAIAGLEQPDGGRISLRDETHFDASTGCNLSPERRSGISMVFQSYALWPNMTALENVLYPLGSLPRARRPSKDAARASALDTLQRVGIRDLADQYPSQMSGGQQQRVALARALAGGGDLILFDEPLSNIDAKVRDALREELLTLQQRLGFAALFVTHDQTEAMILGSRIVVLDSGKIAQTGKPEEIYYSPASEYVARFIGETNSIVGTVTSITPDREFIVRTTAGMVAGRSSDPNVTLGSEVVAVWRPEETALSLNQPGKNSNQWLSNIRQRMFLGPTIEYLLDSEGFSLKALKFRTGGQYTGCVWASVEREAVTILRR